MNLLKWLKNIEFFILKVLGNKMKLRKNLINDALRRNQYARNEYRIKIIKVIIRLRLFDFFCFLNVSSKLDRTSSTCIINDICYISSRNKSICNKTKLSRIKIKEFIDNGLILGFNKYSW